MEAEKNLKGKRKALLLRKYSGDIWVVLLGGEVL